MVVLEDFEGGEDHVLLVHVVLLSLGSLNVHLPTDNLRLGVVVLDDLDGGEGGEDSVLLIHVVLLSPVPVNEHLVKLVRDFGHFHGNPLGLDVRVLGSHGQLLALPAGGGGGHLQLLALLADGGFPFPI